MDKTYSISEISRKTGLSLDTIRYYEKLGLSPPPSRNESGQRVYSQRDMDRYMFISILKKTSMPLKKIQAYMENSIKEDYDRCYELLDEHKARMETQVSELLSTIEVLKHKLQHFDDLKTGDFLRRNESN